MTAPAQPVYCDDCAAERKLPTDIPGCYAFCDFCHIKRACFGPDPDPIAPRRIRIPEWPHTNPLR